VVALVFSEVVDCSTALLQVRLGSYEMSLIALESASALYPLKRNDKALAKRCQWLKRFHCQKYHHRIYFSYLLERIGWRAVMRHKGVEGFEEKIRRFLRMCSRTAEED
jgi:hypothetical protein